MKFIRTAAKDPAKIMTSQNHFEMVLFDFGNVIARFDNNVFLSRLLKISPDQAETAVKTVFKDHQISGQFETGIISSSQFQKGVEEILNLKFSPEFFRKSYCEIFELIPETIDLIRFLHGKTRVGMLSNTNPLHFEEVIKKIPVIDLFDQITVSFEVGSMKPHKEIYLDAIRKSGKAPEKILFLDDIPEYVEGAKSAGIQSVVFSSPMEIIKFVKGRIIQG